MAEQNLRQKAIGNTLWKFMERIIAQAVSMIVSIVLARMLTPDDYGIVSLVTIFITFANVIITGGLNTALIQKKDANVEDYSTTLYICSLLAVVTYIVLYLTSPTIATIYNKPELVSIFRVMGLIIPITAVKSIICSYVSSTLQFRKFFFSTIGGTIVSAVIGICMAVRGFGAWALVAQHTSNTLIDTIILLFSTRMPIVFSINLDRFKGLFKYGWKVLVSSLIDTIYTQLNPLFIGIKYSSADLSFYSKGQLFPNTFTSTVNSTLSAVLFPVMSLVQDDKTKLLSYTRRFIRTSSYLVFPLMLGFFAVSENFIYVILGAKWLPATPYIKIFCISSMFIMIATGNCETIKAMGRSDVFLKMEITKKVLYFITIAVFLCFTKSPISLAISSLVCTGIAICINTFPNRKLLGYSYKLQLADLIPNLLSACAMAICVLLLNLMSINRIALLCIQILFGMIIYVLISILSHNDSFYFFYGYIKKLLTKSRG